MATILSNLNRFTFFFTGRLLGKFAVNWLLKIPPLVKMWWVVNNQIKKGSLPSLSVKNLKSVNSWRSYKKERRCLVHFVRLATTPNGEESARDNHVLACNFAKYSLILKSFY